MAWAFITTGHVTAGSPDGNTFATASCDTTGGNTLFAVVGDLDGTGVVSDSKANTWTQLTGASYVGSFPKVSIWYAKNATCGTGHTFTVTGASKFASICAAAFSGGDTSAPFDTGKESGATGGSVASNQPGSLTPSVNDCLLISGEASDNGSATPNTYSINSPFTVTDFFPIAAGVAFGSGLGYAIQTTAAAANPTWSYPSAVGAFPVDLAVFKSGAAAAQDTPELYGRPRDRRLRQILAQ